MPQDDLALIYDEKFLLHKSPYYHAENPKRLQAILGGIGRSGLFDDVKMYKPMLALREHILLVHTQKHYNNVRNSILSGITLLDPDTYIIKESWEASRLAAGSLITAVDMVMNKQHKYVFSLLRPPGHHAESNRAMGFCIFNNAAIGAQYAVSKYKLDRVLILDWDVHHGNGTQEIFYSDNKVFFISIHQHPLYPGTGKVEETGEGVGKGYNLNFPIPPGSGIDVFIRIFEDHILKILNDYKPQLIIISAGFDSHMDDPIASLKLRSKDFGLLTRYIKEFADKEKVPVISALEGGYNLKALSKSVVNHLREFVI